MTSLKTPQDLQFDKLKNDYQEAVDNRRSCPLFEDDLTTARANLDAFLCQNPSYKIRIEQKDRLPLVETEIETKNREDATKRQQENELIKKLSKEADLRQPPPRRRCADSYCSNTAHPYPGNLCEYHARQYMMMNVAIRLQRALDMANARRNWYSVDA